MLKNLLTKAIAISAALYVGTAFAAVDINKATIAELDGIRGIGPAVSGRILDERQKAPFKDWNDVIDRVKGVGPSTASKYSAEGLTVNGAPFQAAAPAKEESKKVVKGEMK